MSKIERVELFHVEIPLDTPFYPAWIPGYPQTHVRTTLIRLTTDDGVTGIGAGAAFGKEREGLGKLVGGFLLGIDARDLATARQRLREVAYLGWRNWWIEAAFWDLLGKLEGKPVYKLLQDEERTVTRVDAYASSGELRPIDRRRAYLDEIRAMGMRAVKIRVNDPSRTLDKAILKDVRRELGDDFVLGVDANQGWPVRLFDASPPWTLDYATEYGKLCDDLGVAWLEEPLPMFDVDGMAELRRRIATPISGAELHTGWNDLRMLLEHECLDKYQPDSTFCGLTVAKRVMHACRERSLAFSPHTWTAGIGFLVNLHAFAAWATGDFIELPYEPPSWIPERWCGITPPVKVNRDGSVDVPQGPGLGIHLDPRGMRRFARRFFVATPLRVAVQTIREKGLRAALEMGRAKKS